MPKYSEALAAQVNDRMRRRSLGPYDVQRLSGGTISHQTVRNMMRGVVPYVDFILEFAEAVEEEPQEREELANELLATAGKRVRYSRVRQPLALA